ncbi:MAG: PhoH family protein [Acholeplasmataceae bacterium]|nr:PhoH family protein [Acholeplasmataceae bacterium]
MNLTLKTKISSANAISNLVGVNDRNLKIFKTLLRVSVSIYGDEIVTDATEDKIPLLESIFKVLVKIADSKISLQERDIIYIINLGLNDQLEDAYTLYKNRKRILVNTHGKSIYPKTFNQVKYLDAIEENPLTFGVGPAGTGKTYLAVAVAVKELKKGEVKKIILTRPVVEAGESLGFLPGDLKEKVDPYLIPLYDALYEMLGLESTQTLIEKGIIEIAPLAYMRGRTLENAFIILDEAQNTTTSQMKMFLTRLGFGSKMIVTGDPSQVDLKHNVRSGLREALSILRNIEDIKIIEFERLDVVRHPLVQNILERYEASEN